MKKIFSSNRVSALLFLGSFSFVSFLACAKAAPSLSPWYQKKLAQKPYYDLVNHMRETYIYQVGPEKGLESDYRRIMSFIKSSGYSAQDQLYLQAKTNYWMGFAYQRFDTPQKAYDFILDTKNLYYSRIPLDYVNRDKAVIYHEKAMGLAEKGRQLYPQDPRFLFVLAYSNANLSILKGLGYTIAHGLDTFRYTKKALKIDPNFAGPYSVWVAFYTGLDRRVFAPIPFGGRPKTSIKQLSELAKNLDKLQKRDKFEVLMRIAYCYLRLSKPEKALPFIQRSRKLYPKDNYILGLDLYRRDIVKKLAAKAAKENEQITYSGRKSR